MMVQKRRWNIHLIVWTSSHKTLIQHEKKHTHTEQNRTHSTQKWKKLWAFRGEVFIEWMSGILWELAGLAIVYVGEWVYCARYCVRLPPFRQVVIEQWCCAMAKSDCETIHFDVENRLSQRSARPNWYWKIQTAILPSSIDRVEWGAYI